MLWAKSPSVASNPARLLNRTEFDDFMKSLSGNLGDVCAMQVRGLSVWRSSEACTRVCFCSAGRGLVCSVFVLCLGERESWSDVAVECSV